jgi:hypothetical protein
MNDEIPDLAQVVTPSSSTDYSLIDTPNGREHWTHEETVVDEWWQQLLVTSRDENDKRTLQDLAARITEMSVRKQQESLSFIPFF